METLSSTHKIFIFYPSLTVNTICPDGWADYEYSCYMIEQNTSRTYAQAQAYCASLGKWNLLASHGVRNVI